MNIGMLWYDNDQKIEINTRIQRAAKYYQTKYGKWPNICFVHPSMIKPDVPVPDDKQIKSGNILLRTSSSIQPNHFWIGVNGSLDN